MTEIKTYTDEQLNECYGIVAGKPTQRGLSKIICLGQSSQSKGVMFVLYTFNKNELYQDPMQFNCILSNDLLTACKKARKICGDAEIIIEHDMNFESVSIKMQVEFFLRKYPELEEKLKSKNHIIQDINNYLQRKGRLSQGQIDLVNKIYQQQLEWEARSKKMRDNEAKYAHLHKWFFKEKERVEITINEILAEYGFYTDYGYKSIIKYLTKCGKVVIYAGTSPKSLGKGDRIKATIKHNKYKDVEQTLLQRIVVQ